jgi:hypothetical protein
MQIVASCSGGISALTPTYSRSIGYEIGLYVGQFPLGFGCVLNLV